MSERTTIAALATAPVPAALAVIRISGPQTKTALKALFRSKKSPVADPRKLILGDLLDHKSGEVIDKTLAVYMPDPYSYTGEDVAEFQFHGSPLLVQKVLQSLFAFGITPAEPGEFTMRAFLNGKLDLVQAEAIAELISAGSEHALKIAGEHLKGKFSQSIEKIGLPLRETLAELEAQIDFPEEGIEPAQLNRLFENMAKSLAEMDEILQTYNFGHIIKEGYRVMLCGRPNVGKSSILNLLLNRERAIVTDEPGTTRDLIEEEALIDGYRFVFCDSAGIRPSLSKAEIIGVELAKERISWADLVLYVVDASSKTVDWQEVLNYLHGRAKKIWMITNKIDLNPNATATFFCDSKFCAQNFYISAKSKAGLDALTQALVEEVAHSLPTQADASNVMTNERQRNCLIKARENIAQLIEKKNGLPVEIICGELRLALSALDEIIGKTYNEDILSLIFSKFCIGK